MGCDIHLVAQKRGEDGKWVTVEGDFGGEDHNESPFSWRSYGMFGFLANVRNYSQVVTIAEPRGIPWDFTEDDFWIGGIGGVFHSWLTIEELEAFDYDQVIEDRRYGGRTADGSWSGTLAHEPGEGAFTPLREFLGEGFFDDLKEAKRLGVERVVFGFSL